MKKTRIYKCWGIPFGNGTQEITIEYATTSIKAFKAYMREQGHKLTGHPYRA